MLLKTTRCEQAWSLIFNGEDDDDILYVRILNRRFYSTQQFPVIADFVFVLERGEGKSKWVYVLELKGYGLDK